MKMKKTLCIVLAALLLLAMVSCGSSQAPAGGSDAPQPAGTQVADKKDGLHFVFVCPYIGLSYWSDLERGLKAADEEFGTSTDFIGPETLDTDAQISMMEASIASGVDGILVAPLAGVAFKPVIEKAKEQGIPVICLDADCETDARLSYIGMDNTEAGRKAGELMVEATGGKAKIGIITGALDQQSLTMRQEGFEEVIGKYPDMEVVAFESADSDMLKITEKTQTMLQAHPEIDAMFGTSQLDMVGAAQIIREKGLTGKITLVNFDDAQECLDLIKNGEIYGTIAQRPFVEGYLGVKYLIEAINGKEVPARIDTGSASITTKNIDDYKKDQENVNI